MTLTFPGAPLASEPPATTNYAIEGPRHRLLLHPFPRRVRARFAGEVVLDSTRGALLHESNILPRLYVPLEDVRADLLERTDHATHCPFKGDASYWSVRVGDRVAENAVWTYEDPIAEAAWLRGLVSVYPERMDTWLDEDEEVTHLRDPYHRVDARRSSRRIEVRADGEVIARSERPVVVAETGPPAALLPPARGRARRAAPQRDDRVLPLQGRVLVLVAGRVEDVGLVLRGSAGEHAQGARPRVLRREQGRGRSSWPVTEARPRRLRMLARLSDVPAAPAPLASRPVRADDGPALGRLAMAAYGGSVDDPAPARGLARRGPDRGARRSLRAPADAGQRGRGRRRRPGGGDALHLVGRAALPRLLPDPSQIARGAASPAA